jgi:hypothetical protein
MQMAGDNSKPTTQKRCHIPPAKKGACVTITNRLGGLGSRFVSIHPRTIKRRNHSITIRWKHTNYLGKYNTPQNVEKLLGMELESDDLSQLRSELIQFASLMELELDFSRVE